MTDRPSGVPEATAGAVDLLKHVEHARERERELEAEIASLREQNATLRAEVERLTNGGAE